MLVYQCNSCKKLSPKSYNNGMPDFPSNWGRITVDMKWTSDTSAIGGRSKITYDLCDECVSKPITFGNIELNWDNDEQAN